jgi:hypothetical protein
MRIRPTFWSTSTKSAGADNTSSPNSQVTNVDHARCHYLRSRRSATTSEGLGSRIASHIQSNQVRNWANGSTTMHPVAKRLPVHATDPGGILAHPVQYCGRTVGPALHRRNRPEDHPSPSRRPAPRPLRSPRCSTCLRHISHHRPRLARHHQFLATSLPFKAITSRALGWPT